MLRTADAADQVTVWLDAWSRGDQAALERLVPVVHRELHRLARRAMRHERADHTLQPTALVNEVYLRLIGVRHASWKSRTHFYALSARLMRHVLVDLARSRRGLKRGGGVQRVELVDEIAVARRVEPEIEALDDALRALAGIDPRKAQVVELRFFGGLDIEETAEALNVSRRTVFRDWTLARAWLFRELRRSN